MWSTAVHIATSDVFSRDNGPAVDSGMLFGDIPSTCHRADSHADYGTLMRSVNRLSMIAALCLAAPASAQYSVSHTYPLGGDGTWDYVIPDPAHHRLFIARQNRVMVVDERSGKLLGETTGIQGAHGVALVDRTGRGFATSGNDSSIYTFDTKTLKLIFRSDEGVVG